MPTFNIPVIRETDMLSSGGTVASNGTFATVGSTFTYDAAAMPWYTMQIVDNGADQTTLSSDTDPNNTDGGPNTDNEGSDGETGTLFDPNGNSVGTVGGSVAADRWAVLEGSDGSTIFLYEIENFDDIDVYAFSAPLVDGVTYTTITQNARDTPYDYGQIVCIAEGTYLKTPRGPQKIDDLKYGDWVVTADNGPQMIQSIVKSKYLFGKADNLHVDRPVHIRAKTIGNTKDLIVSPQHRIVVKVKTSDGFEERLVAAKHLAEEFDGRIRYANGLKSVVFYNLLFDRHEIVFANGAPVESLYPGPEAKKSSAVGYTISAKTANSALWFATTADDIRNVFGPHARRVMGRSELRRLLAAGKIILPNADVIAAE